MDLRKKAGLGRLHHEKNTAAARHRCSIIQDYEGGWRTSDYISQSSCLLSNSLIPVRNNMVKKSSSFGLDESQKWGWCLPALCLPGSDKADHLSVAKAQMRK